MDIKGTIFPVHILDLVRKIRRPSVENLNTEYYSDHFFARLVKSILENRDNLVEDSTEILAIQFPDGNKMVFKYIFDYLQNGNPENFELPRENIKLCVDLLFLADYYGIDGLKELILDEFKNCCDKELHRKTEPAKRIAVNIKYIKY